MKLVGCWTDGTILKQEDNCLMDSRQSFGVESLSSAYLYTYKDGVSPICPHLD
ncbi:MAG: hypothetical protein SPH83_06175 [Treponema sp.]|nr:hypothetical protein [Spirochaetales bacterium]MDY6190065.1 hypothetical protein [Treponema sp.]